MHEIVFHLGLIFLGAWSLMKFIRKLGFPSVTAYILFGILIGPGVLDIVNKQILSASPLVATIALSFIAFSIGQNFVISELKTYGKMVLLISVWEAFLAWILVALVMHFFLGMDFPYAFCLGAVACATAPAATMLIIREYRASGLYTKTLLGVVALDDAWCLIIISISISIAKALIFSQNSHNAVIFFHAIAGSIGKIVIAFVIAGIIIYLLKKFSVYVVARENLLLYVLGFLFLGAGISEMFHIPLLLTCMLMGAILANITVETKFFDLIHEIDNTIYLLFFVLSGASLEVKLLREVSVVAIVYFLVRLIGKFIGSFIGAEIAKAPPRIKKNIWWGLAPQAGVALGAALIMKEQFPQFGDKIFTTIITTTIIYEILGPVLAKIGLKKAGEI